MHSHRFLSSSASIALLILVSPAIELSQVPPAPASALAPTKVSTVLRAHANLVLVDAVVTDKGKAVHNLDRNRFHIFEDGREQTISAFDEHQPAATSPVPRHIKLPPNSYTNIPIYPDSGVVNVLLLDGLNTPAVNQMDMRRQMIEYMGKVQPGTSMAIFTLASQLRLVSGFTNDPSQLVKAMQSAKGQPQPSVMLDPASAQSLESATDEMINAHTTADAVASMQQFAADIAAYQTDVRVRMTLDGLQDLARYLGTTPGRKNLIWFSGSFPIALEPDSTLKSPYNAMRNYADDIRETNDLLTAARVAVYPVDARGLVSMPSVDASYKMSGNPIGGGSFARDTSRFLSKTINEQGTMQQVAEETGGEAFLNTNDLTQAMTRAVESGSSYYTISYVPSDALFDGKFHKLLLRIDNASYKLAYRRGYYADAPDKAVANTTPGKPNLLVEAAMHGAPPATQILFQARVLPSADPLFKNANLPSGPAGAMAASLKAPVTRYAIQLSVDPRKLTYEETPDGGHRTSIEFAVMAYDENGKRLNYYDRAVQLNLKPDQFTRLMATGVPALLALDLPVGKVALRIIVLDQAAGRAGSIEVPLMVAAN